MESQSSQQQIQPGPTIEELLQGFREGGDEKVSQMLTVNGRKIIPSPADLFLAYKDGGEGALDALMTHMDKLEVDNPDPEFYERRWERRR